MGTLPETVIWAAAKSAECARAYEKGTQSQWNPERVLDWTVDREFGTAIDGNTRYRDCAWCRADEALWLRFQWEYQKWLVWQFLHGEEAALIGAARLIQSASTLDAKKAAAVQAADEARHADVFGRYLNDFIPGDPYPVSPPLRGVVMDALQDPRLDFVCLGIHVMVEGVALATFRLCEMSLHDRLIRSIVRQIHADEARHLALGAAVLRESFLTLTDHERRERAEFIADAVGLTAQRFLAEEVWERVGVDRGEGRRIASSDLTMTAYRRTILLKTLGMVRMLGLADERLERDFRLLRSGSSYS